MKKFKENEDERIKREILELVSIADNVTDGNQFEEIKDWLEKQGEQKPNLTSDIEIPFGADDSELQEASYHIPKGFHAEIKDDKVIIKRTKDVIDKSEIHNETTKLCKEMIKNQEQSLLWTLYSILDGLCVEGEARDVAIKEFTEHLICKDELL